MPTLVALAGGQTVVAEQELFELQREVSGGREGAEVYGDWCALHTDEGTLYVNPAQIVYLREITDEEIREINDEEILSH